MWKVMLVDDEEWCLKELHSLLKSIGQVEITGEYLNAMEALTAFGKECPDMVFIDVWMPGMTGFDLAERLKRKQKGVKIVLVSENECFARNGFDIGVDDFILKPLRKERVFKALQRLEAR